ncbi:MAG: hypothetical protein M0Z69_04500 [Actinomycetota bacterium]|nr:hypothetical protein [Actinomycetota bacterium]
MHAFHPPGRLRPRAGPLGAVALALSLAAVLPSARAASGSALPTAGRRLAGTDGALLRSLSSAPALLRRAARPGDGLAPNDSLPRPGWWNGACDGGPSGAYPGSMPNGAVFDGLPSCGPGPNQGGADHLVRFFAGAWGEFEWECVELSMRWMYQAWGVPPYGANGNSVVANYPMGAPGYPALDRIANGTVGHAPQPGDVISVDNPSQFGHTEVIAFSSVSSSGNGWLKAITENWAPGSTGWVSLSVSHWVVSDNIPGDEVVGWLHDPGWSLQAPVIWDVTPGGDLQVKDTGGLAGPAVTVANGIASASVVGGEGHEPAPLVAALTTGGSLIAGYLLPGTPLRPVASGVSSFSISSGDGWTGQPVLAWTTSSGALEVAAGNLHGAPVTLVRSGVRQVVVAAHSGTADALVGILTGTDRFEVAEGNLHQPLTWSTVARSASAIGLAGGGDSPMLAVEAYLSGSSLYERQGTTQPFTRLAAGVRQFSVAAVGPAALPLVARVSGTGVLTASLGSQPPVLVSGGVASVSAAAGPTDMGFPMLTFLDTAGRLWARQGTLSWPLVEEAPTAASGGGSDITFS